jgi:peptidase E
MSDPRHIVALGGGGFSMEDSPVLDEYILSLARQRRPRVGFVPTASGDAAAYLVKFYRAFAAHDCIPSDVTLTGAANLPRRPARTDDLRATVLDLDVVYVGGGNTVNLLAMWRAHGLDDILREAWHAGIVLAGVSAGMICWFSGSITDSFGDMRALRNGLGLIDGSACPHYDGEPVRRAIYHRAIADGLADGWAADDGVGLHFAGTALTHVVSSRPTGAGYRVERRGQDVVEDVLPARRL